MEEYKKFAYDLALNYAKIKLEKAIENDNVPQKPDSLKISEMDYFFEEFEKAFSYYLSCGIPKDLGDD